MKPEKYLPIGTVVLLEKAEKKLMITGFCAVNNETKEEFDYCGCLYPEGQLVVKDTFLFNHDQIVEIFYLGYDDDEEKAFKSKLNELVSKANK